MSSQEIRAGQLLTTFGPGALVDFVDESVIITGLKFWYYDREQGIPTIQEPRLESRLRNQLRLPYLELRRPPQKIESFGESKSFVKGFQFPEWVQVQHTVQAPQRQGAFRRRLVRKGALDRAGKFIDENGKKHSVVAVRFVQACPHGHISDIDWNFVLHGSQSCSRKTFWLEEGSSTSGLASVKVLCECGKELNLSELFKDGTKLGPCKGLRPWLGYGTAESCAERNKAVVRSASNVYYPQLMTVISIPEGIDPIWAGVNANWGILQAVTSEAILVSFLAIPHINNDLGAFPVDQVFHAIQAKKNGEEPQSDTSVKEVEFLAFSKAPKELMSEIPKGDYFAREIEIKSFDGLTISEYLSKVVAVHKLREVSALYGFTRLEPIAKGFDGEPDPGADLDIQLARIGIEENWLPAIENRGEGIFVQFDMNKVTEWKERATVISYEEELRKAFLKSSMGLKSDIPFPGAEYYLAHSLCHLLMTTFTLECGYPSSSLKERIYLSDRGLGFLIYTASPDAEGTLGGLIQKGRELGRFLALSIEGARLCSNDPLCASHKPDDPDNRFLSGAACHSCLHVPETSCEQWNQFLDRNLVVETLERKGTAYFQ